MTVFFIITLGISIVGLMVLLRLKQWELSTGKVVLGGLRPKVGAFFEACLRWLEQVAPELLQEGVARAYRLVRNTARHWFAKGIVLFERGLETTLYRVRQKTTHKAMGENPSPFLREVAEHKQKLLERPGAHAIFEE